MLFGLVLAQRRSGLSTNRRRMAMSSEYCLVGRNSKRERERCKSVQFEPCDTISPLYPVMYGIVSSDSVQILYLLFIIIKSRRPLRTEPESFRVKRSSGRGGTVSDLLHSLVIYLERKHTNKRTDGTKRIVSLASRSIIMDELTGWKKEWFQNRYQKYTNLAYQQANFSMQKVIGPSYPANEFLVPINYH